MKKHKILLLIIGILLSTTIFAQDNIKIGINAGATYSKFRGNEIIENTDSKFDFLFGVSVEKNLKEDLSIKTNLNYERKSFSNERIVFDEDGSRIGQTEIITTFNYLSLPVLIKYNFGVTRQFFINGGPYFGFLLNTKSKTEGFPDDDSTYLNKKIDVGISLGIGKKIQLNNMNDLSIELRNNLGLINISDVEVFQDGTIKTNSLNLILTWNFQI